MTQRDWSKVGVRVSDPGAVVGVSDNGGIWCGNDEHPFVPRSLLLKRQAARARRKRRKQKTKVGVAIPLPPTVRIPASKIHLIRSVMSDLGRPIPNRIATLDRSLNRLVKAGVITENGEFNKSHPLMREWLERLEKNERRGK